MAWETFKRSKKQSPKSPMVTLSKSGQIGLNAAVARDVIGDNRFVLLLFDKSKNLLGLKLLKHNDPDAYPIKVTTTRSHGSVTGLAFMKAYGIFPLETVSFPATFDANTRVLAAHVTTAADKKSKRKARS